MEVAAIAARHPLGDSFSCLSQLRPQFVNCISQTGPYLTRVKVDFFPHLKVPKQNLVSMKRQVFEAREWEWDANEMEDEEEYEVNAILGVGLENGLRS